MSIDMKIAQFTNDNLQRMLICQAFFSKKNINIISTNFIFTNLSNCIPFRSKFGEIGRGRERAARLLNDLPGAKVADVRAPLQVLSVYQTSQKSGNKRVASTVRIDNLVLR